MRTLLVALALAAAALVALLAPMPTATSRVPSAAEYCVVSEPLYYDDTMLLGEKTICVPGP